MELSSPRPPPKKKRFFTLNKTPLGESGCLSNASAILFTVCSSIHFFNLPPFPNTVILDRHSLPLTVQNLCDLQYAMSRHVTKYFPPNPSSRDRGFF